MPKPVSFRLQAQAGDALLDSLIAMLVLTVVGIGPIMVTAKALVAQRQATVQQLTSVELREAMQTRGLLMCDEAAPQVRVGDSLVSVGVNCPDRAAVTINGVPLALDGVAIRNLQLSVSAPDWFGGSGTLLLNEVDPESPDASGPSSSGDEPE